MTEKKHAIKPYPLGAHVEDGAIRFAYASGKRIAALSYMTERAVKITQNPVPPGRADGKCLLQIPGTGSTADRISVL